MKKNFIAFLFYILLFITNYSLSQWDTCSTGLSSLNITGIIKYQNITYLSSTSSGYYNGGGLYYSTNNGSTWFPSFSWAGLNIPLYCILEKNGNLFASGSGIYKSTNLGYSWQRSDTGIAHKFIRNIVVYNNKLFAASDGSGIYVSTNDGVSWFSHNTGITDSNMYNLKVYGTNFYAYSYSRIYKSTNEGNNWTKIYDNGGYQINDLCEMNNTIFMSLWYRGFFKSTNNGTTWDSLKIADNYGNITAIHSYNNILFANGNAIGMWRSTDNGVTWKQCGYKLGSYSILKMLTFNNELYAFPENGGLFKTTNNGDEWQIMNNKYLPYSFSPKQYRSYGNMVLAFQENYSAIVSTNNGASWSSYGMPYYIINDALVYNNYAFAAGWNWSGGSGIFYSTNYGITWDKNSFLPNATFNVICKKDNAIYFGGNDSVLYKTTNFGNTFSSQITSGLPRNNFSALRASGNYMFAELYNDTGIYRSSDNGLTWTHLYYQTYFLTNASIFTTDLAVYIWAPDMGSPIWRSTDYGDTWTVFSNSILSRQFYISEPYGFLISTNSQVYKTTNDGRNWVQETSLGYNYNSQFTISQNYAIFSFYNNIMRSKLFDITNVNNNSTTNPGKYELYQNYPNPFNPVTTIGFEISKTSFVSLKVYDISGRLIRTLINNKLDAGTHNVIFYAGDISSGIYFYTLSAGEFTKTKKLVLLK